MSIWNVIYWQTYYMEMFNHTTKYGGGWKENGRQGIHHEFILGLNLYMNLYWMNLYWDAPSNLCQGEGDRLFYSTLLLFYSVSSRNSHPSFCQCNSITWKTVMRE